MYKIEKLDSRNTILSRENELLKHQLKKYVGAVQKLRDGPQVGDRNTYEIIGYITRRKQDRIKYKKLEKTSLKMNELI